MSVEISQGRLSELEDIEKRMNALEAGGVENWEWYGESLEAYSKEKDRDEELDVMLDDVLETLSLGAYEPSEPGAGYAFLTRM